MGTYRFYEDGRVEYQADSDEVKQCENCRATRDTEIYLDPLAAEGQRPFARLCSACATDMDDEPESES
jgi:hypothetical protein